ncbi:T9SS type A sorting domain-containing protein [Calditrichota bacterium]
MLILIGISAAEDSDIAIVQAEDNGQDFRNGDRVTVTGTGFNAQDNIKYVIFTLLDDNNRNLGNLFAEQYNLRINNAGEVSGFVKLDLIPIEAKKVVVQLVAEKTSVQGSNMILVEGDKNFFVAGTESKKAAGIATISDPPPFGNNNGVVLPGEVLAVSGSGWTASIPIIAVTQHEYSDVAGTIQVQQQSCTFGGVSVDGSGNLITAAFGGILTASPFAGSTVSIKLEVFAFALPSTFESAYSPTIQREDQTAPTVVSVNATSQTNIEVVFDESVSEVGGSALARFSISGSYTLSALSGSGDTWNLTLSGAGFGSNDPVATLSYSPGSGSNELQDGGGNEVATFTNITIGDQIAPTQPTLTAPVSSSVMDGSSFDLTATADPGSTDASLSGVRFDGRNGTGAWNQISTDNDKSDDTYSITYNLSTGTKYDYYRAVAIDDANNETPSASSPLLTDAFRIEIAAFDTPVETGQRSQFDIEIQDNYGQAVSYPGSNKDFDLSVSGSTTGLFYAAASGGSPITSVEILKTENSATFYYEDNTAGNPSIRVEEQATTPDLEDYFDVQAITVTAAAKHFHVYTAHSESEVAGTSFNITVELHNDSDHSLVTSYTGNHSLTWSTTATASPDGTPASIPSNGNQPFSSGAVTITGGGTLYNSNETPNITVTDGTYNTLTTSAGNAGYQIAVAVGAIGEVRIKTADESSHGDYDSNIYGTATFQGPTLADPDETTVVYAVRYDDYGNLLYPDIAGTWGTTDVTNTLGGTFSGSTTGERTFTVSSANGASVGTVYEGTLDCTISGVKGSTGTITVDDYRPAQPTSLNVSTDGDDNRFVFTYWATNSRDDGTSGGAVSSFDIRWRAEGDGPLTDGNWETSTSVGTSGKPSYDASSWRVDMSGYPPGNKYFGIRTVDDVGNYSLVRATTGTDYSLPVELVSFEAQSDYSKVTLNWTTASEIENLGFNIYRSTSEDMNNWQQVNESMIPGQGNSAEETEYQFVDENVVANETYVYKLESVSVNGEIELQQLVKVTIPVPKEYVLFNNHPNPFNPVTNLKFQLPDQSQVSVTIYDIQGHLVKKLLNNQTYTAGEHTAQWDATDDVGQRVATGMYIYRFTAGSYQTIGKMILMK